MNKVLSDDHHMPLTSAVSLALPFTDQTFVQIGFSGSLCGSACQGHNDVTPYFERAHDGLIRPIKAFIFHASLREGWESVNLTIP